jgi:molybdenum cofactor biosynthesis protein B
MGHLDHKHHAPKSVACMVITISDTRTEETDVSGKYLCDTLKTNGYQIAHYSIVKDEPGDIQALLRQGIDSEGIQVILCHGGTGISQRDRSYEAVVQLLEKQLDGFGELFRMLSYQDIGSAAMMSRAVAGIAGGTVIFSMPGSKSAVALAMEKLILPELGHLVWELQKHVA